MGSKNPIQSRRRAGICLPLWSLLSRDSFEAGDFLSLLRLLPFLKNTGFTILQILPLNDCGFGSSPYSSLSGFAIDPLYLSAYMEGLPLRNRKSSISTNSIHKSRITEIKLNAFREYYNRDRKSSHRIAEEFIQSYSWVRSYVVFKYFYKKHRGMHWREWEILEGISGYSRALYETLSKEEDILEDFYWEAWLQNLAFNQLSEVKKQFEANGILLKGDMPILTSGNSCDVWLNRDFYRMDLTAGAPPDAFSSVGQNWGFPLLDWEKMKSVNYLPWKEKLQYQENFFHLYRIDHVIGLYRIWAIPLSAKNAKYGYFFPQKGVEKKEFLSKNLDPLVCVKSGISSEISSDRYIFHWDFHLEPGFQSFNDEEKESIYSLSFGNISEDEKKWKKAGEDILDAFESFTNMVPCAEDLGSVPGFVRDSLQERELFGIDVIRWTRSFEDGSFIPSGKYRNNAISTLSTHDTSIALDWWMNECSEDTRAHLREFFLRELDVETRPGSQKPNSSREDLSLLLDFAFSASSQFSIQMLSDILVSKKLEISEDWDRHKINTPGTAEHKNWKYRYAFYAEDLSEDGELEKILSSKIRKSNR